MTRAELIRKAYNCIDEVYPEMSQQEQTQVMNDFHIGDFLDDSAKQIVRIVPIRALGRGTDIASLASTDVVHKTDGSGYVNIPSGFIRLLSFKMSDWEHPVHTMSDNADETYIQQANPILGGTPSRPKVFLCEDKGVVEFYRSGLTSDLEEFRGFVMTTIGSTTSTIESDIPDKLADAIAWNTALSVLSAIGEVNSVKIVSEKLKQTLETL